MQWVLINSIYCFNSTVEFEPLEKMKNNYIGEIGGTETISRVLPLTEFETHDVANVSNESQENDSYVLLDLNMSNKEPDSSCEDVGMYLVDD